MGLPVQLFWCFLLLKVVGWCSLLSQVHLQVQETSKGSYLLFQVHLASTSNFPVRLIRSYSTFFGVIVAFTIDLGADPRSIAFDSL